MAKCDKVGFISFKPLGLATVVSSALDTKDWDSWRAISGKEDRLAKVFLIVRMMRASVECFIFCIVSLLDPEDSPTRQAGRGIITEEMESPRVTWRQKTEQELEVRGLKAQPSQLRGLNKVKFIELLDHAWHIASLHAPWHLLLQVGLLSPWAAALLCCITWTLLVSTKCSLLQPNSLFPFTLAILTFITLFPYPSMLSMFSACSNLTACLNVQILLFLRDLPVSNAISYTRMYQPAGHHCSFPLSQATRLHFSWDASHPACMCFLQGCVFCLWTGLEALGKGVCVVQCFLSAGPICRGCSMHVGQ